MWRFICGKKSRDFFRFWFSQLFSQFGDRLCQMALMGLGAIRHPGSTMGMALLFSFTIIPVFHHRPHRRRLHRPLGQEDHSFYL